MSYASHQHAAETISARCAILTLSDTRDESTDTSGKRIRELLESDGHTISHYEILKDDPHPLAVSRDSLLARSDIDVILTTGGTGIAHRDQTIDVLENAFEQKLPGFGELFRMLSYEQIKSGAMLSRATAGIARGKLIFAMPGSTKAVELAMQKLILPELRHLIFELRK